MGADGSTENSTRLEDWVPLDLKGKPLYHGIDETERMNSVRPSITAVRERWNDVDKCQHIQNIVQETIKASTLSRELRDDLNSVLQVARFWADQRRPAGPLQSSDRDSIVGSYDALQLYTTNAGYKKVFGYINQLFRREEIDEQMIQGAAALVELLTIDVYNLRLDNFGRAKYYNFTGIVHRAMTVTEDVMDAFYALLEKPLKERNFSVPLAFVSTSVNERNLQEFFNKDSDGKQRLHWKIHVGELDPRLLASYRQQYPASVVSTINAMPISHVSEFPNEQEVLLHGPFLQLLRIYEEPAAGHTIHVLEMVMLNANRDHATELAHHHGVYREQRVLFGRICAATKYDICASLARKHGLPEAKGYEDLYAETLELIGWERTRASLETANYDIWATSRPSWIGASLKDAFPKYYVQRRDTFSKALFSGGDYSVVEKIIDDEYEWQKGDWCNVPRLFDTATDATNGSGFTALHQAAYNNASLIFVQKLIDLGAWRTMKAQKRERFMTAREIAIQRSHHKLIPLLEPRIHHTIAPDVLEVLERRVHELMREMANDAVGPPRVIIATTFRTDTLTQINRFAVRMPQLNVLTEIDMVNPSLWVPIPSKRGVSVYIYLRLSIFCHQAEAGF
ncbi:MAG: hypothetical protein Q9163_004136 [Psora crenata]